ncbi:nicotinamide N-methyltransferase [Xenopus tropicalis]|uniref:Nicotinamide N-methyltransferase n=1 Tax=Xenopus tropicalis TaxID=8364 RepID=A0A8J0QU55_XENTR|nr:nicotinamide N-methyltransferase [Xenopus tropicalis]|eukprot:XP_002942952.2 PREDICTED: nicotinamide N-methyltransferase-like [Xenopus tropicalis]
MATDYTGADVYQKEFDPRSYLETYYNPKSGLLVKDGYLNFALKKYHETFTVHGVKGETLIDVGHGPTIYQDLSACESFREIIGAEYTDRNREYYEKTLRNEPGIFDWTSVIQAVCDLEGKGTTVEEKREKLKNTVKKTIKCDVTKSNPVAPLVLPKADCVMANFCLDAACKDLDSYCNALNNISSLLKVGGHLIIVEVLNSTFYWVGGKRFSSVAHNDDFIRGAITNTGYAIIDLEVFPRKYDEEQYNICGHDSTIFVLARKLRDI